jgi:hypothetical protein
MNVSDGTIFVPEGSAIRPFAETISWLWRLPVSDRPSPSAAGLGTLEDAPELEALLRERRLAGAVVTGGRPGPDRGRVPGRQRIAGVAKFTSGISTQGDFIVLHGPGAEVARSSLGPHALRDSDWLTLGYDPVSAWGTVQHFWALPALGEFLADVLDRPMATLPPLGVIRYDDVPGSAPQQLQGQAKSDGRVVRRLRRLLSAFRDAGGTLNAAVTCRALDGEREVPLEQVWPRGVETLAEGIEEGTVEQVCHGYLHLDTERTRPGAVEPREFATLDRDEAHRRIAAALEWAEANFGRRPPTFVAPNWVYGEGALAALEELELPAWLPVELGPLVAGRNARETLVSTLDGLHGTDYGPLGALAGAGLPPMVVIHGGLIDGRFQSLRPPRDLPAMARLALRRDLPRLPRVQGVRWVGASELMERLRAHDETEVVGGEIRAPDGVEVTALTAGAPSR